MSRCSHPVRAVMWLSPDEANSSTILGRETCCVICGKKENAIEIELSEAWKFDIGLTYDETYYNKDLEKWEVACDQWE